VLFLYRLAMWQQYVFYVSLSDALWWAPSIFKSQWFLLVFKLSLIAFCCQMCFNAFDKNADLNVMDHPILNFIYYLVRFFFCVSQLWFIYYQHFVLFYFMVVLGTLLELVGKLGVGSWKPPPWTLYPPW
jgi:hypothetical protein